MHYGHWSLATLWFVDGKSKDYMYNENFNKATHPISHNIMYAKHTDRVWGMCAQTQNLLLNL